MADPPENSPSGAPVLRHKDTGRAFTPPAPTPETLEELEKHLTQHFGEPTSVLHELLSDLVHLDVHLVPPGEGRDYWTLFTTGMSDCPMTVPPGAEAFSFAELILKLPASWPVEQLKVTPPPADHEQWYWPIGWLKQLARLPHEYQTWLGFGHTVPNGDPPQPFFEGTKLCAFILIPPISVPAEARAARLSDGRVVNLYVLHALHLEELNLKLNRGSDALLEAFSQGDVSEVLDPARRSTVRRKLFGLF